uniref:Receptor expression-enhancing protein n=1 Tax=Pectinophora gossypiella TaxID=13191 RepID=A0A1E1WR87_PECGO
MISSIISRLVILVFGTLYPAYASYKAVRTKNLKEYVKWMMYWIVFALFTCTETFTDVFLSWFPFYYEVKIVLVLWLLSPATKGSSILYRKFVHPALCRREQEIDEYIAKAKDQGYHTVLNLGTKGVNYATTVIMQTAIKNFNLPSPEQGKDGRARPAIRGRDVTDYPESYEDLEYQRSADHNLPGIVEIVELDSQSDDVMCGDGDANDPEYEPSSARSRGNVVRKRKVAKEKRPRSRSRGRRTRSQAAAENQLLVD